MKKVKGMLLLSYLRFNVRLESLSRLTIPFPICLAQVAPRKSKLVLVKQKAWEKELLPKYVKSRKRFVSFRRVIIACPLYLAPSAPIGLSLTKLIQKAGKQKK